jgi:hypothetical protein
MKRFLLVLTIALTSLSLFAANAEARRLLLRQQHLLLAINGWVLWLAWRSALAWPLCLWAADSAAWAAQWAASCWLWLLPGW